MQMQLKTVMQVQEIFTQIKGTPWDETFSMLSILKI